MPYMTQVGTYSSKTNNIYNFYIFPYISEFVLAYRSSTQFANLTDLFRKNRPKTDPISRKGLLTGLGLLKQTHFVTLFLPEFPFFYFPIILLRDFNFPQIFEPSLKP